MQTCIDCGKPVSRYARQCADCYRKNRSHAKREYLCIDCGQPISRRAKRCPDCNSKFLENRPTYERTEEHKERMKAATQGKPKPWQKGRKRPDVAKKISAAWTPEMREAARRRGKKMAKDRQWILKIAEALSGENNPNWKGGIANAQYAPGFNEQLKQEIRERDRFTCQLCYSNENELGYSLSIHHIDYDKTNHSKENLVSLCKRCNSFINTGREFWTQWFQSKPGV